ncbi:hypothetical protein F4561_001467 [Lipingzhangella halophila]|uniref:Uncharacterized protein n=1 Tax=Lipingzhangella halophila TaxID=1783352 RepID=A0A7W7REQ4_9ACTN|nr:hypothetical protein [Lipingzhangella halophila]MBB4930637.1 hypothetical protein [Lipingzhangella halophila]MBB4930647.1 hypothetical protein [Lipingzhangella halophila]
MTGSKRRPSRINSAGSARWAHSTAAVALSWPVALIAQTTMARMAGQRVADALRAAGVGHRGEVVEQAGDGVFCGIGRSAGAGAG